MLISLKINNIALISESNIKFETKLNLLTGETGAGKSIIIDALNFVLGSRADKTLIKNGEDYAKVEGVFEVDIDDEKIEDFFKSIDLEPEDTVIISRTLTTSGKNECRVNGELVTLGMLKKLTVNLVDIHGQQDNQMILDNSNQLSMLDQFALSQVSPFLVELNASLTELKFVKEEMSSFGGQGDELLRNIDIIKYQIDEIDKAQLQIDEDEKLKDERLKLQNASKIYDSLALSIGALDGDYSVLTNIKDACSSLSSIAHFDEVLSKLKERLDSSRYELEDICESLKDYNSSIDYSEDRLNEIEDRLDLIADLKRKYGATIPDILTYLSNAQDKLNRYEHSAENMAKLEAKKSSILTSIYEICVKLTKKRKEIAKVFEQSLLLDLNELNMPNANFVIEFADDYSVDNIESRATKTGADNIRYLFSANLGEPAKPLDKIISGGEMSRFMLAFKCVVHTNEYCKTFVFDEIDAGIGGKVGVSVGQKLAKIGSHNQVLCISHLAQIASFADSHFKIEKYEDNGKTYTKIDKLDYEGKVEELSRMIGDTKSEYARLHAKEMLEESTAYKANIKTSLL